MTSTSPNDERRSLLTDFIIEERGRYVGADNNLFAFALGQPARYYEFLCIIADRHRQVAAEFIQSQTALHAPLAKGETELSEEQMALWARTVDLGNELHLQIEAFYLFAKILLDRLSQFISNYFGQSRGHSLASHDKLVRNISGFASSKGIALDPATIPTATALKSKIADFRDKQIAHEQNPRTIVGTSWSPRGDISLMKTHLYPRSTDTGQADSAPLPDLFTSIDDWIELVLALVRANRQRSRYTLGQRDSAGPAA